MYYYDKDEIKMNLTIDQIFNYVDSKGGNPEYTSFGLISSTVCHNLPGDGSRKLYYYDNTKLFKCYTGCDSTFDIFELEIKTKDIQEHKEISMIQAVSSVAYFFGIAPDYLQDNQNTLKDWDVLTKYEKIQSIETSFKEEVILPAYDKNILTKLIYPRISIWEKEGIDTEVMKQSLIGYYPVHEQITIPHFDINNRLVGLRGRSLVQEDADLYGKYRPLSISKTVYKHPLGLNLYNINLSKKDISTLKKAIIFESEKSTLLYRSFFDTDISVACCGSSVSDFQINKLIELGAEEIIIAFDRQFQLKGDNDFLKLKRNLLSIHKKYYKYVNISIIFDSKMITGYKASPIDEGKSKFITLFKERIVL